MLFRFVFFLLVGVAAMVAFRYVRTLLMASSRRLGSDDLSRLKALGKKQALLREAYEVRERIHQATSDDAILVDVDDAIKMLLKRSELVGRLDNAARDLAKGGSDEAQAALEVEIATTSDPLARDVLERKLRQAAEQRDLAADLQARKRDLLAAQEKLVLGLKDVQLAALQHAASSSGDGLTGVRDRLQEASADLRLRAAAIEEVEALIKRG